KFWRHNTDDGCWLAIQEDGLTDHIPIAAKSALPQSMTDDRNLRASANFFRLGKRASQHRIDTEHLEQVGRNSCSRTSLRIGVAHQREADIRIEHRHVFEAFALFLPIQIVPRGRHVLVIALNWITLP